MEYEDYFQSKCFNCPEGLVGGHYREWVPCDGGSIYDSSDRDFWRECDSDKICPVGTRYEFPRSWFPESFEGIKIENFPETFDVHKRFNDHTATIVIFTSICSTLILFITVAIILSMWKSKALFVFRELDKPFITGGRYK